MRGMGEDGVGEVVEREGRVGRVGGREETAQHCGVWSEEMEMEIGCGGGGEEWNVTNADGRRR